MRRATGQALAGLRLSTLAIVEAVQTWLLASDASAAQRQRKLEVLEEKRKRMVAEKQLRSMRSGGGSAEKLLLSSPRSANDATIGHPSPPLAQIGSAGALGAAAGLGRSNSGGVGGSPGGLRPGGKAPPPALFSAYSLRFACHPPNEGGRTREAPGLWDGINYILKMATDVWRLPVPSMSDPFTLRWFGGTSYDANDHHAPAELNRMMAAEAALKRLFPKPVASAMEAVESTIAIRMVRPPSATP